MKQDQILGVIRALLSAFGGYFLGKEIFGTEVDDTIWQGALGVAMGIASIVLSVVAKTLTLEMIQGTARQILSFFGGIYVAKGVITAEMLTWIIGGSTTLIAWIQSKIAKKKNQQLAAGEIKTYQLKK